MNKKYNRLVEFDENNEIVGSYLREVNSEVIYIKKGLTEKQKKFLDNKTELQKYSNKLGGYIHMCYVRNELLFNKLNVDRANISRLIYLSTYIDYNNRQENLLIKHTKDYKVEAMTRADIKKALGLGDTAFKSFMSDMRKNNLLFEVAKKFYISNDYFNKGDIKKSQFKKKEYTRIFIDTTRLLYEGCNNRQHKQLSYAFQLVPFVHYETNILCTNPSAINYYDLDKMGLIKVCEILGLSTEKAPMSKFENDLLKLQIKYEGNTHYLFKRVIVKGGNGKFDYFVINPQVVWGGKDIEKVKETIQLCFF